MMKNNIVLHTEKVNDHLSRIMYNTRYLGEAIKLDDGYYHFSAPEGAGTFAPHALKAIANLLDELNKEWDAEVTESLGKLT